MASRDTRPSRARDDGYTLTELLVVLLILGLLAAALTPITIGQMNQAKVRTAKLQMEGVAAALALYVGDVGRLPAGNEGLRALMEPPASAPTWAGPYLRSADRILDPWGRPIQLVAPASDGRPFVLRSLGADGAPGGKGADADIEVF